MAARQHKCAGPAARLPACSRSPGRSPACLLPLACAAAPGCAGLIAQGLLPRPSAALPLLQVSSMLRSAYLTLVGIATSLNEQLGEGGSAAGATLRAQVDAFMLCTKPQQEKALRSRRFWEGTVLGSMLPALKQLAAEVEARNQYSAAAGRLPAAQALAALPCSNPLCTRLRGASEARLRRGRRCGGCGVARFCCEACRDAAWPAHAAVCTQLAAAAAAAAAPGGV